MNKNSGISHGIESAGVASLTSGFGGAAFNPGMGDEPQSFALNGMGKSAPPKSQKPGTDAGLGYISLFPNPTAGSYTVKLSKAPEKPMHFHWYTDQMQILSSGTISSETFTGDISSWADGVYILRVYSATEQHSFKVVKVTASPQ